MKTIDNVKKRIPSFVAGIKDPRFRWPKYQGFVYIPYGIDQYAGHLRQVVQAAVEAYRRYTCIRFVPWTNQRDYIRIFSGIGCWSLIGRNGGEQKLSLGQGCVYVGLAIHELGHAAGLFHMHQRSDRNNYIYVYRQNVIPNQLHNFDVTDENREIILGPYDYDSIMHYGSYAFSRNPRGLRTMEAKNGHPLVEPWQKRGFTSLTSTVSINFTDAVNFYVN
ncbi:astacin-like metalloprotease toxin 1 [Caerostris extrusa]|uniref:Metalloendopeptidase n=1 Tax=Caerostris extrusa TaxID=172846 RepID=A0AAV4XJS1_CAEEX|nr:astacin-like metalloprotease toxin 1 [Caerostris extrusa]